MDRLTGAAWFWWRGCRFHFLTGWTNQVWGGALVLAEYLGELEGGGLEGQEVRFQQFWPCVRPLIIDRLD